MGSRKCFWVVNVVTSKSSVAIFLFLFTFHITAQTDVGTFWVCHIPLLLPKINFGWCFQGHVYCRMLPVILSGTGLAILLNLRLDEVYSLGFSLLGS